MCGGVRTGQGPIEGGERAYSRVVRSRCVAYMCSNFHNIEGGAEGSPSERARKCPKVSVVGSSAARHL
eukprot:8039852-Pyramimonas_sp.AAC.1